MDRSARRSLVGLASDELELVVAPDRGARLHRLRVRGRDVLRTPGAMSALDRAPFFWGAFVMAPWCNRAATGPLEIAGRTIDLAANFPDGSAIHGRVYRRPWQRMGESEFVTVDGGDRAWPWRYETRLRLELDGLTVRLVQQLTNASDAPMPAGLGIHPWFAGQPRVAIHAALAYGSNSDPGSEPRAVAGGLDLPRLTNMAKGVDATWTGLAYPAAELRWPGLHMAMSALTDTPHLVAANLPGIDAIALETQTHAPRGFRRLLDGKPGAVSVLEPGATLTLTTVLEFAPVA